MTKQVQKLGQMYAHQGHNAAIATVSTINYKSLWGGILLFPHLSGEGC